MKKPFALGLLTLVITQFIAQPAYAFNDWYKQGYTDGALYVENMCSQRSATQLNQITQENARLRQQIAALKQQVMTTAAPKQAQLSDNYFMHNRNLLDEDSE